MPLPASSPPARRQPPLFLIVSVLALFVCLMTPRLIVAVPVLGTIVFAVVSLVRREKWSYGAPVVIILALVIAAASTPSITPSPSPDTVVSSDEASSDPILNLVSAHCSREYGFVIIEGTVQNTSSSSLDNVEAVGAFYGRDGAFVKSDSTLINFNPVLAGQASPFKVMTTDNPAISACKVQFKSLMGGTIGASNLDVGDGTL